MTDSLDSARETAFQGVARQVVGGGLALSEYAERAVAIQQVSTTGELDFL